MVWRWPWRSVGVGVKFHCAVGYLTTATGQPSIRSALQQYSYLCPHPHTHPQPLTQGMLATCWRVSFIFQCNGHSRIGHVRFWFCSTLCTTRAHISLSAFVISLQPLLARHLHTHTYAGGCWSERIVVAAVSFLIVHFCGLQMRQYAFAKYSVPRGEATIYPPLAPPPSTRRCATSLHFTAIFSLYIHC